MDLSTPTPAVQRALGIAQLLARRLGEQEVRPFHIFQALLQEEEGLAATTLQKAGLSLDLVRQGLPGRDEPPPTGSFEPSLALSAAVYEVLKTAAEISLEVTGERIVAGDHLVVAIVRRDRETRAQLETLGLDVSQVAERAFGQLPTLSLDEPLELGATVEQMEVLRILDAGANRANEALRVIEDYCRFVLDDAFLCRELKEMRHDLSAALADVSSISLAARDTLADVGTAITTAQESARHSASAVIHANLKRLQEALRSLEEFSKLSSAALARKLEGLRYRSYTVERAITLGASARRRLADARLYVLISSSECTADLEWTIGEATAGGAQIFQLREKGLDDDELLRRARRVRQATNKAGVLLVVNDRPDIARIVGADGVHLGQNDLPIKEARRITGPKMLIGISTHTIQQVREAILNGASYIGVGPTFPSKTKSFSEYPGLDFVHSATAETSLPCFVIGGVNQTTIVDAIAAGAQRVAVGEAICKASEPRAIAAGMRRLLNESAAGDTRDLTLQPYD